MPIIEYMLDQDFYKFNMMQAIFHRFPDVNVEYEFKLRNYPGEMFKHLLPEIESQINHLCTLRFKPQELDYISKIPWLSENFIEYLRLFQLNNDYIKVWYDEDKGYYGNFRVSIKGSWLNTILFEVPVLAIISELFSKDLLKYEKFQGEINLTEKLKYLSKNYSNTDFNIADFGTRRRFSQEWQGKVISIMLNSGYLVGTSNVHYARVFNIKPIGTQAHEWFMAMQALTRVADSQKFALENWVQEYRGRLGIALTDTIGIDSFLKDFDLYFAKLFDGCRQDSGDPIDWTRKLVEHYNKLGIDPKTKTAVYSDGLTFGSALDIYNRVRGTINLSFGIGTNLTNDVGITAPQIVIKMTKCNGKPVAKVSDSPGKSMCPDKDYVNYIKQQFGVK